MRIFGAPVMFVYRNDGVYITPSLKLPAIFCALFLVAAVCMWFAISQTLVLAGLESEALRRWSEQPAPRGPIPKVPWTAVFREPATWDFFKYIVVIPAFPFPILYGLRFQWLAFIPRLDGSAWYRPTVFFPFASTKVRKDDVALVLTDLFGQGPSPRPGKRNLLLLRLGGKLLPLMADTDHDALTRRASVELVQFCRDTSLELPKC
jgi:hypothetical protein